MIYFRNKKIISHKTRLFILLTITHAILLNILKLTLVFITYFELFGSKWNIEWIIFSIYSAETENKIIENHEKIVTYKK